MYFRSIGLYMPFELLHQFVLMSLASCFLVHDHCLLFLFQSASQVRPGQFAAGFVDASVRIFDVRTPDR